MARITKKALLDLAKKVGCELEFSTGEVEALAPPGKRFACDPVHALVASRWEGEPMTQLYQDLADRLGLGIEDCNCQDCRDSQGRS